MIALTLNVVLGSVLLGKEARLFKGNVEIVHGRWTDDEDRWWEGTSGIAGCVAEANQTAVECELKLWFKGMGIEIRGRSGTHEVTFSTDGGSIKTIAASFNSSTPMVLYAVSFSDVSERAVTVRVRSAAEGSLLYLLSARVFVGTWHAAPHWGVSGSTWQASRSQISSSTPGAYAFLQIYGGVVTIEHASEVNDARVEIDGAHMGTLSSGFATTFTVENGVHTVVVWVQQGSVTLHGAEVFMLAQPEYAVNFGGGEVLHEGVLYKADDEAQEAVSTANLLRYSTLPHKELAKVHRSWRKSAAGEALEIVVRGIPGLYTLRLLISVSLQHLHEEAGGYNDQSTPDGKEEEPRVKHKASVPKEDKCECPAAASYLSTTESRWEGVSDPLKGLYCSSCKYTDWRVKYYCTPKVTVTFNGVSLVEDYELGVATGGLVSAVEVTEVVEIKESHQGLLRVVPAGLAHHASLDAVALLPLVSTSYFMP